MKKSPGGLENPCRGKNRKQQQMQTVGREQHPAPLTTLTCKASQVRHRTRHLEKPEKGKQVKPSAGRRREITKTRKEINKSQEIEKISKMESCFF